MPKAKARRETRFTVRARREQRVSERPEPRGSRFVQIYGCPCDTLAAVPAGYFHTAHGMHDVRNMRTVVVVPAVNQRERETES
jgi:hypothetical protein